VSETTRCPQCGAEAGLVLAGLCPSCLLGLAAAGANDGAADDGVDDDLATSLFPKPTYRVLNVLSTKPGRTTYLAERGPSKALVALDIVALPTSVDDDRWLRMRERVRALRRLDHPCIPRVLEGRRTSAGDGCVVSAFVSGPRLDRYCSNNRLDGPARVRIFEAVCEAVAYGHRAGVCHGRLGPECVIVRQGGGTGVAPLVLGYTILPDAEPTVADDLRGLEAVARGMGWQGGDETSPVSVDDLCSRVCATWRGDPSAR
jgi:serine/threonine protein kinase